VQRANCFKSGRSGRLQVVDKKLQLEGAGVGGPQSDTPGEVCGDTRSERDDAHLRDINRAGELHQVEVELMLGPDPGVVGEGVEEEELQHAAAAPGAGPPTASSSAAASDPHESRLANPT
jgi:hypothetical protein